jgi:hypothetical protein
MSKMPKRFYWVLSVLAIFAIVSIATITQASQLKSAFRIGNTVFPNKIDFIASGARCGARIPSDLELNLIEAQLDTFSSNPARTYSIPVAVHVISNGDEGNVSDADINQQIQVLNQDYTNSGFSFSLASISRTSNAAWFNMVPGSAEEAQAKSSLVVSPQTTLNLYTSNGGGLLATNPNLDGVVVYYASLPNGPAAPYNLGKTAVHEVGHWVGLLHTFPGIPNCAINDRVTDTAAGQTPAYGCPINRDTCPGRPGFDPITNYMNYTDDACMSEFSAGQVSRALKLVERYRTQL